MAGWEQTQDLAGRITEHEVRAYIQISGGCTYILTHKKPLLWHWKAWDSTGSIELDEGEAEYPETAENDALWAIFTYRPGE